MMMMMTWHSLRTARTRNSNVGSHSSQHSETLMRQNSCKTGQKVQSSVFCGKLVVTAMNVLSPANCSKQMQQPPGRLGFAKFDGKVVCLDHLNIYQSSGDLT